ncbi:hypothetical protein ZWY2020_045553 [Hordeum vulgare]|nr:hypothetical protein ZWY2020_045553 [Hordeum vulgare]
MAVAVLSSSSAVADEAATTHRSVSGAGEGQGKDAGAAFVLESKGTWWHAGFHLTTAMVGPAVLSLPYALRGIGWALGLATLTALAAVSFYTYYLMSRVLDHCEAAGRRHIRFRDLAADVLGSGWAFYLMVAVQGAINVGVTIGSILLAGNSLQIMYTSLVPDGPLKLYHFIIAVASVLALLSQMPSFHSLRYINLGSLVLSVCYTILVSAACIRAGLSSNAPAKDYSLSTSKSEKTFDAFLSVSILAAAFGNGILPEIQATLVPPAAGKMVKALVINYSVAFFTFYPLAITGYWAFGKTVQSNAIQSLMPDAGPSLAPRWLLCLTVVLVLFQLLAIALLYAQVVYEVMEKRVADAARGRFSCRNVLPRVATRTLYVVMCAFVAAALPFFGEIVGVIGSVGYIPLDFILPVVMYNMVVSPPRRSVVYMTNVAIMVLFAGLGAIGAVASVRKLVLNAGRFKLFNDHVVK